MSELNDFIHAQHETNLHLTETLSRIEQSQKDTVIRLFGGEGQKGVLPYMIEQAEETARAASERTSKIEARVTLLENWKLGTLKWVAGCVAVLALEGTAFGMYLTHISKSR